MLDLNDSKKNFIPNYTGHIPENYVEETVVPPTHGTKHIPGYGGYVPAIKAENMFGKTYGKCTLKSKTGDYDKGIDLPALKKFKSLLLEEFVNQAGVTRESAAKELNSVNYKPDNYQRPIDPSITNKFWGTEDRDEIVDLQHLERNAKSFYGVDNKHHLTMTKPHEQQREEAVKNFFGLPEKEEPEHILPIPGYCGVSRRVAADNVFGMTYAEARRCADQSLKKINEEKGETLKENSKFVPEYNRPKPEDEFW